MNKRHRLTFEFFDTLEQAAKFIDYYIKPLKTKNKYLYYKNKNIKALDWTSEDRTEHKKILWYYI